MNCPICQKVATDYSTASYYKDSSGDYSVRVCRCIHCDVLIRNLSSEELVGHYAAASYTSLDNEERFYSGRINFFKYLHEVVSRYTSPKKWLDYGSSYSHFSKYLESVGIQTNGVELDDDVRAYAVSRGYKVEKCINDLSEVYDVVSFVDSFYCIPDPVTELSKIKKCMTEDGVLLMRITNRLWLAKLRNRLGLEINGALGDATISYNKRSIVDLLNSQGFEVQIVTGIEAGKEIGSTSTRLFYKATMALEKISGGKFTLTPGLVIIARIGHRKENIL